MGRASRWLHSLFGGGKKAAVAAPPSDRRHSKEKRRWGFVKSFRERPLPPPPEPSVKAQPAVYVEEEQNKRAIAVAAATAAVAEAAVAAAHAAAAVVRLTSSGRSVAGAKREECAAVKIQAAFRGYLARRALRALKGLVKLQALVRGNIVRKQAAETLRCMQALVRVQARARACRAIRSERSNSGKASRNHPGLSTPEKRGTVGAAEPPPAPRADRPSNLKAQPLINSKNLQRNSSKQDAGDHDRAQTSAGWNWLDRWMEERYWDTRESARRGSGGGGNSAMDDEKNAKILEIDPGKPHCNTKRRRSSSNHHHQHVQSSCSTLTSDHHSRSFATVPDGDSDSTAAAAVQQSVPSPPSVGMQQCLSPLRFPVVSDAGEFADSPQFFSASSSRPGSSRRGGPFTPAKSDCSRSLFSGYSDYPNYMANTESWRAKVRSQSAPKQRPELEKRASQKSSLQAKFATKAYPGSGRLDRLGMPLRY